MNAVCQQHKSVSPRQFCPQTFQKDQKLLTPYRFEDFQTSQSYLLDQSPKIKQPCKRVNSPGLPECSFRMSHKKMDLQGRNLLTLGQINLSRALRDQNASPQLKQVEIGLVTERSTDQQIIEESPEYSQRFKSNGYYVAKPFKLKSEESQNLHSFNPQQYQLVKEDKECQAALEMIPEPEHFVPVMQPKPNLRNHMQMVDKLETDKLCVEIFMSERDENSLIFTGITKKKLQSPQDNKKIILDNLQELFSRMPNQELSDSKQQLSTYIKMESLEQSMFQNRFFQRSGFFTNEGDSQQYSNHVTNDLMSISSAQSIQMRKKCQSQQALHLKQQTLNGSLQNRKIPQKPLQQKPQNQWNSFTKKPAKQQNAKVSKSPFLKSQPKPKGQGDQNVKPTITPTPVKNHGNTKSMHTITKSAISAKVRSFHVSPEKIDSSEFDERFYQNQLLQ